MARQSKRDARVAYLSIRRRRALELRAQGKSYTQIERIIQREFQQADYTNHMAADDCKAQLKENAELNSLALHEARELELSRYDDYLDKIYPRVANGDIDAIQCSISLSKERAKILGLYAPVEMKVQQIAEHRINHEITILFEAIANEPGIPDDYKQIFFEIASELTDKKSVNLGYSAIGYN